VKFVNKVKDDDFLISFITSAKQLKALPALKPGTWDICAETFSEKIGVFLLKPMLVFAKI
jgi:hypothetical protein